MSHSDGIIGSASTTVLPEPPKEDLKELREALARRDAIRSDRDHSERVRIRSKVEGPVRWTKTVPTIPGHYWWRAHATCQPDVRHVERHSTGVMQIYRNGNLRRLQSFLDLYHQSEWSDRPLIPPTEPEPLPKPEQS